jgi:hypothetical protein
VRAKSARLWIGTWQCILKIQPCSRILRRKPDAVGIMSKGMPERFCHYEKYRFHNGR